MQASYREVNGMSKIYTALGLMSGTSLDGIDVALIRTDGENTVERGPSETFAYGTKQQAKLREALHDGKSIVMRADRPASLMDIEQNLTEWHTEAVQEFIKKYALTASSIDVIGFHGQTIIHRPEHKLTVQLGLGAQLSKALKIPVVYDMRAADVAAGGQGAPLVPIYHRALAKNPPVAFVNIGGVANVTYVGANGELLAFDTGPGNALINDWVQKHNGQTHDAGGTLALQGKVSQHLVDYILQNAFFKQRPPKSLDRNSFAAFSADGLSLQDGAATLSAFTVNSIAKAAEWFPAPPRTWIICGGGRHNAAIMQGLKNTLINVESAEEAGFNGDSLEAEAWAYLAVRSMRGLPITFPGTTGVAKEMSGGILVSL
jgi:anhydro-N-acetylmuramic acid kinase